MTIKKTIIGIVKKIRCKCSCFGGIQVEIKGSNTPPNTPVEFDNSNANTFSIENNVSNNVNLESVTPAPSPVMRRSPAPLPRPLPIHTYTEVF